MGCRRNWGRVRGGFFRRFFQRCFGCLGGSGFLFNGFCHFCHPFKKQICRHDSTERVNAGLTRGSDGGAGEVCRSKELGMGGAGGSLPEQGVGNGRRGKGGGRYGAATEGACCGRREDERAIRRGGSGAGGENAVAEFIWSFFFIYFRICHLSIFSLKYKQLKKLTGEENC